MKTYQEKQFNIPELKGVSKQTTEEHLKLYSGYVKHTNLILEEIGKLRENSKDNVYTIGELRRRLGFEFCGMRNHEYYFASFENGPTPIPNGEIKKAITEEFGSFDEWISEFEQMAATRGIGWAMLYYDKKEDRLLNAWIDEQHLGHLTGLQPVLALDMWEHSFVADYQPSGKKQYIGDFFENLNWKVIEENYLSAKK